MGGAPVEPQGNMQVKYDETIPLLINTVPYSLLNEIQKLSWKTLSDRFKNIMDDYRTKNRKMKGD